MLVQMIFKELHKSGYTHGHHTKSTINYSLVIHLNYSQHPLALGLSSLLPAQEETEFYSNASIHLSKVIHLIKCSSWNWQIIEAHCLCTKSL